MKYKPQTQRSDKTNEFIDLIEGNSELKTLLIKSIEKAKMINPDSKTNPAQTLEQYYDFIEWSAKAMPWTLCDPTPEAKLFDRISQSLIYLYFISDQPLEELESKGYYNNSIQYHEPYRSWLVKYAKDWGQFLSSPESWNDDYYQLALVDDRFGLNKGWYEGNENWKSFNDFFARYLVSPSARPIAEVNKDDVVTAPADSEPQGVWAIDENSYLVQKEGVLIKSKKFYSIAQLVGPQSGYKDAFAGGTLTHTFLDVNDYHRYHFPVGGRIKEILNIPGDAAAGGITTWDTTAKGYDLESLTPIWQSIETRGLVIVETPNYGVVALLPVGMVQVCSVNFETKLKVGDVVKKGDMMGYFLFGGSDFVMLFQQGVKFDLTALKQDDSQTYKHILMGQEYAQIKK